MPDRPKLSICVPSRNRQDCFRQTILDLIANPRGDLQFVFADNSDDPSIMNAFFGDLNDARIIYLPSAAATLSIADNWERTVAAATGDWVCVIGDDDYIETNLPEYIAAVEARDDAIEVLGWNRAPFQWRAARTETKSIPFSLANKVQRHTQAQIGGRLFGWHGATYMPQCPYGIYHAAVPRRTLDRIRHAFSDRLFEHHTVDYAFCHKLVSISDNYVFINRPMSILGVSPSSGSAAVGNKNALRKVMDAHEKENASRPPAAATDFPFGVDSGVAGNILSAQTMFLSRYGAKYGKEYPGWEERFCHALTMECQLARDIESYSEQHARISAALTRWRDGKYLPLFTPSFDGRPSSQPYWGLRGDQLRISQEIAGAETPREFYRILQDILPAPETLEYKM